MKSKKLLLGSLSAMALVATPIAAVVSCDDGKKAEAAAGDKKAAFSAADLIKKIGKDDKGFAVTLDGMGVWYVSAEDAATKTTIEIQGNKVELPIITANLTQGKATATKSDAQLKADQDAAKKTEEAKTGHTPESVKAAVEGVKKTMSLDITAVAGASTMADQYVIAKHSIMPDASSAAASIKKLLVTVGGEGLYKFDFTTESLKGATPVLKPEAKVAFDKIFTDLGLIVKDLTFAKTTAKNVDTISIATFVLDKKTAPVVVAGSTATDLGNLKTALGTALATAAGGALAGGAAQEVKAANAAMTPTELLTRINALIHGTGAGIASLPQAVTAALIKDDMHITLTITTAAVMPSTNGVATLSISAGNLAAVTVTIALTAA